MTSDAVELREIAPGVAQITMQDRTNKNTLSAELIDGLTDSFERAGRDTRYRAIVLTGYDTYFCSGGTQEGLLSLHAGQAKFTDTHVYGIALNCEIPVVSAMQGHGIGGGFAFGLSADCVVLSRESMYTTNFMKYGFTPDMGATLILPQKLGHSLAEEMLLTARNYRGADLEKKGIPFPVLPRAEVLEFARQLACDLAQKPRVSLVTLKSHLVAEIRKHLPVTIEQEVAMHDKTFRQPSVKERIQNRFGK